MSVEMACTHAQRTVDFLMEIGLDIEIVPGSSGFVSGINIHEGALHVDPGAKASNLLHEAGHLAIVPSRFRGYLSGNLAHGMERIFAELEAEGTAPDAPVLRAMMQTGDTEATAWAWAAGKALDLPEEEIIRSSEYGGEGDCIRFMLSQRAYIGIHGISHAGFCLLRGTSLRKGPIYPQMAFWLQH